MKKLCYIFLILLIFQACKDKEVTPTIPILQGFETENNINGLLSKSTYTLIYNTNNLLSNLQRIDTTVSNGKTFITPLLNNTIAYETADSYRLVADIYGGSVAKLENTAKKNGNTYELVVGSNGTTQSYDRLELNDKNQLSKYLNIKQIYTGVNGKVTETPLNKYFRFEYDNNGNVLKVYTKFEGQSTEYLTVEYTYDKNPNPLKALVLIYRFGGIGQSSFGGESNNNIVSAKSYNGTTVSFETTCTYKYDATTKYPISCESITKELSQNTTFSTSKTIYKY